MNNLEIFIKEITVTSKTVKSQVKKAVQLIEKEHWPEDQAILACHTTIADEISFEEFEELVGQDMKNNHA